MATTLTWPVAIWGALGVGALVRAFWNPTRVVTNSAPLGCPGVNCDPSITFAPGAFYAVTSGRIVGWDPATGTVQLASRVEPVVVTYQSRGLQAPGVGTDVRVGQQLGSASGPLAFAVQQVQQGGRLIPLEPASWLAARGLKPSSVSPPLWCAAGRKVLVPRSVASCGLRLPDPASVLLLPVTTTTE